MLDALLRRRSAAAPAVAKISLNMQITFCLQEQSIYIARLVSRTSVTAGFNHFFGGGFLHVKAQPFANCSCNAILSEL